MNEKEMIEEMAKVMAKNWFNETITDTAERLINEGYRKIPEGSVVLSKEENENWLKWLEQNIEKARQKTAKEIIKFVSEHCDNESLIWLLDEFAKKYGVKVEE